jgi:RHS repeat-associated protein
LVTGTTLGSVTDTYSYNQYGELGTYEASYGATPLYSVTYDEAAAPRDELGRVVQKTETLEGITHVYGYTYDQRGRLTDVVKDGVLGEHYEYDLNGNRTSAIVGGEEIDGIYDDQDRLLNYGDITYTYTANGELLTKTGPEGTTTYGYDAQGSLVAVELPDGMVIEYATDGPGRRVGKRVDGMLVRQWLYQDRLNPVAELDGSGNLVAEYIYGTKPNVPDYVVRGGNTYRIVSDQLGSPVLAVNVADETDVPFRAEYSAFGEMTGDGLEWMAFGFAGGLYDSDTGLVSSGAREYDASVGRWTRKDPVGFEGDGGNLYGYALGDPVNYFDPYGEGAIDILLCMYYGFRLSDEADACREEVKKTWDPSRSIEELCSDPNAGGSPEQSYANCLLRKNRKLANKFFKYCGRTAAGYGSGNLPGAKPRF